MQPVFSFKLRGAYNKMAHLTPAQLQARRDLRLGRQPCPGRGAVGAEARLPRGHRHADHHAADQGRRGGGARAPRWCWPAIPTTTPTPTRWNWPKKQKLTFVHPFDDPDVIAGQGTIGMESCASIRSRSTRCSCRRRRRPDRRGGGLHQAPAAGDHGSSASSRSMPTPWPARSQGRQARALESGRPVRRRRGGEAGRRGDLPPVPGIRRRNDPGRHRRHLRRHQGRVRGHPLHPRAGRRAGVAGAKAWAAKQQAAQGKTLVAVASGANMNFDRLRFVAERAEVGEQREAVLAVTIPRSPAASRSSAR
jgi:threonine dehydratase